MTISINKIQCDKSETQYQDTLITLQNALRQHNMNFLSFDFLLIIVVCVSICGFEYVEARHHHHHHHRHHRHHHHHHHKPPPPPPPPPKHVMSTIVKLRTRTYKYKTMTRTATLQVPVPTGGYKRKGNCYCPY
jgi:G3E family GTPase